MRNSIAISLMCAAIALLPAAGADEVWTTDIGDVIYETDLESGTAVLSYPLDNESARGMAYIFGLAGQYEGRTGYDGIWIEPEMHGAPACGVQMARPDTGELSENWGRLRMVFVDADYPSVWVALRGECFSEPTEMLVGRPVLGSAE